MLGLIYLEILTRLTTYLHRRVPGSALWTHHSRRHYPLLGSTDIWTFPTLSLFISYRCTEMETPCTGGPTEAVFHKLLYDTPHPVSSGCNRRRGDLA